VGGLLKSGIIREGDWLQIGPSEDGCFTPVQVSSLQRHKVACRVVRAGESATLALNSNNNQINLDRNLRKGMVLIHLDDSLSNYPICMYFQARIHVLFHATMIYPGCQTTVYIGNVRQTAVVIAIMGKKSITTNETASVMFRFIKQPEYINPGSRLLFREGPSKGIGRVLQVFPFKKVDKNNNS
jgi:GTPase